MKHDVSARKPLLRNVALLGIVALLSFGVGMPAQAASANPSPGPIATPAASANAGVAKPTPLPANAAKPGVKPKATSRLINKKGAATVSAPSASLPAPNCSPNCDLWALAGSINVAGGPAGGLPVWGFSTAGATGPALVPGPTLIATVNDNVQITLHNLLPNAPGSSAGCPDESNCMSLEMPAVTSIGPPDQVGVGPDDSRTYRFGKLAAGTYIYQAGPTPHAQRQIRMGLAGLLIVRPADYATTTSAYGAGNGLFSAESTAVLNEFDADFNADPFNVDPLDYKANLFLFNGLTFDNNPAHQPFAGRIPVGPGDVLLMRYANLGTHDRGMTILNERQAVLGQDSRNVFDPGTPRLNPSDVTTVWMTPGQVTDAFVSIDPQVPLGTQLPIFESGYHLNNLDSLGLGGAFSYLDVVSGVGGDPTGPTATVVLGAATQAGNSPSLGYTGAQDLSFTATLTATTGNLSAGEWFLDSPGAAGTGFNFNSAGCVATPTIWLGTVTTATFKCTISALQLDTLVLLSAPVDGDHVVWAHGQDSAAWGVVSGDVFTYNIGGPDTGALTAHSTPTNEVLRFTDVANGACKATDPAPCLGAGADKPVHDLVVLGTSAASLSNWVILGGEYCILPESVTPTSVNCPSGGGSGLVFTTPGPVAGAPRPADACTPPPPPPGISPPSPGAAPGGASLVSFCADVPPSVLASLNGGVYNLYVHAYEAPNQVGSGLFGAAVGRWGNYSLPDAGIGFVIDRTGPAAGNVIFDHDHNNGTLNSPGNLNFLDSLQVGATLDDSHLGNSKVALAEVFLTLPSVTANPVPPDAYGTGAEMIPSGARWDSPVKTAYAYIPLAQLTTYPEGKVRFWAHGLDIAGNWGSWTYGDLTLDRTAPKFNYPTTPDNGSSIACQAGCSITIDATDPVSGGVNSSIVQAEWFVDAGAHLICEQPPFPGCALEVVAPGDPGQGLGIQVPIGGAASPSLNVVFNPLAQPPGTKIVFRVKDAAGNWSLDSMVLTT
jgi:FtsP/CotA-like multicopper oxidase with cupredoxin domain